MSKSPTLSEVVREANRITKAIGFPDYPGAHNGLQLEGKLRILRIAAAVDSHERILDRAIEAKADLLVVHHGLWWNDPRPLTGVSYRKISKAIAAGLAVYSNHLPLDAHAKLGNNAILARRLGIKQLKPFFEEFGCAIGWRGILKTTRTELRKKLETVLQGPVTLVPGGSEQIREIGIVTGGAGSGVSKASALGVDAFITGEGTHATYGTAHELGINLFYGGHYRTEVFGVQALAVYLSRKFGIPWEFLDDPSGL